MIPYGRQDISRADIAAVVEVLGSDWLTQGPAIPRFEQAVATYCGARHAVAVCNATSALHLACTALGLGPGRRLWTSPNTFVASANCALYCDASVDFVDIDPSTLNMSVDALAQKLTIAERSGTLPDIVVPVHFAGQPCEMDRIGALSQKYGFSIIEDASHAIGARFQGIATGACKHSAITVFSFHPVKIITTGEGGLLLTNSDEIAARLADLRAHGITRDTVRMTGPSHGAWYYEQTDLGFNYRMTDIQAALGLSQLQRIEAILAARSALASRYTSGLESLPIALQGRHADAVSAWHLFVVRLLDGVGKSRREVFDAMRAGGIGVNVHYIPVHLQPYYRRLGFGPGMFPQAERYYEETISLPLYPSLGESDQDRVMQLLTSLVAGRN